MRVLFLTLLFVILSICEIFAAVPKFTLTSPAFKDSEVIPNKYTCDGKDVSPALYWKNPPPATQSFVLIVEDKDAPVGSWIHWIVYNIPPMISNLPEALPRADQLVNGEIQGRTDFQILGYGGPCPPSGTHRYYFTLYALDYAPALEKGLRKNDIMKIMKGHILGKAILMGQYTHLAKKK